MAKPKTNPRWPQRISAGLDMGSRAVKLVKAGPEGFIERRILAAVPFVLRLRQNGGIDRQALGIEADWPLVVTGYGRAALPAQPGISEIRAHFQGALGQTGLEDFTLVELGGQDSKVIQVEGGRVLDFVTNDRCAAGTGRYLENMIRLLGVDMEQLTQAREAPVEITNTCATFGETEILGRLVEGVPLAQILAGINWSVARRVAQMVRRHRPKLIVFCGGVALNSAISAMVEEICSCPVLVPPEPQHNGALGCCLETNPIVR